MGVPGEILGYFEAKEKFGNKNISMKRLLEPTISLCEKGISVTRTLGKAIASSDSQRRFKNDETLRYALYITKCKFMPRCDIKTILILKYTF